MASESHTTATTTQGPRQPGSAKALCELHGVTKRFPGVVAVDSVDLSIRAGEVHVVAGENGAGKSTLMNLLAQADAPDAGEVLLDGQPVSFHGPRHAQALGVAMVHQEFALAPHLSVAENLSLGREHSRFGLLSQGQARGEAKTLLDRVGLEVTPERPVYSLSVAECQRLEIAKALAVNAKLLILDEPTATLTEQEIVGLFELIGELTAAGIGVVYISHRLEEIFRIGDRVTVLRDGKLVATTEINALDERTIVRQMVGREIENLYPKPNVSPGEVVLRASGISRPGVLEDCGLEVRSGEIVGLAGLVGAGRSELARAIFGADAITAGEITLDGGRIAISSPRQAIKHGICYLTEDRKAEGLAAQLSVAENITLAAVPTRLSLIDLKKERERASEHVAQLDIRTPSLQRRISLLSGGTQQKVVVAKWLEANARVLFFDEPARGIDVGSKAEMFELIAELARAGRAIVLISSYLPELINMCDRVVVMRSGRITGELSADGMTEEAIMALATGAKEAA
jgi:ribose transport system ATP-binding protein